VKIILTGRLPNYCFIVVAAAVSLMSPSISQGISISPSSATVSLGATQQFTATGGATWVLEISYFTGCPQRNCIHHVAYCAPACGTVSPASTASGVPTTYSAPTTPQNLFPPGAQLPRLEIVASYVASAVITIPPIIVSVSPTPATVPVGKTRQVTATVLNDGTKKGVTWTLEQNGVTCSSGCGTISPTKTATGTATTYTAPASSPIVPVVTLVATSVEDPTKSGTGTEILITSSGGLACSAGSGHEALLKGQYAFLLQAFGPYYPGGGHTAGSITADGSGRITGGEENNMSDSGAGHVPPTISTTVSSYAVGPDRRGCLLLADADGTTSFLRLALGSVNASGVATGGRVIEFGDPTATETRAAGLLRLQDPTSFSAAQFKGNYAFGTVGRTPKISGTAVIGSLTIAGTFAADGVSGISSATIDLNLGGSITSDVSSVGSFVCCDAHGGGSGTFTDTNPATNFGFYQINSSEAFFLTNNDLWGTGGQLVRIPPGTVFSQASLKGVAVLRETLQSGSGPGVNLATVVANGNGTLTLNNNLNSAGAFTKSSTPLTYQVSSNGRVTLAGTGMPPVLYLYGPNRGFLLGTDADVSFGILEPQTGAPFSNSSFSGAYTLGTENPSAGTVMMESGIITANGSGHAVGTADQSIPTGLAQNQSLNFAYSFGANGNGNLGSGTTAILISGTKMAYMSTTDSNPAITVVEK